MHKPAQPESQAGFSVKEHFQELCLMLPFFFQTVYLECELILGLLHGGEMGVYCVLTISCVCRELIKRVLWGQRQGRLKFSQALATEATSLLLS